MSPYSPVRGVVAVVALAFDNLVDDHGGLVAGVGDDLAHRLFQRTQDDLHAGVLVVVVALDLDVGTGTQQGHAAASDDAFFNGGTRGVQRVFDAAFFSFISTSVAAPTLISATPPASLATRSCSFSLS